MIYLRCAAMVAVQALRDGLAGGDLMSVSPCAMSLFLSQRSDPIKLLLSRLEEQWAGGEEENTPVSALFSRDFLTLPLGTVCGDKW